MKFVPDKQKTDNAAPIHWKDKYAEEQFWLLPWNALGDISRRKENEHQSSSAYIVAKRFKKSPY